MAAIRPSFFKPLMKNFSTVLWLPPAFVRKHRHLLPEKAKLRIRSGKSWTVKIEKGDDDEDCFFTEGWSDFVKDLGLQQIQILINKPTNLHATVKNCEGSSIYPVWRYVKELKKHHFSNIRLGMPNTFVMGVGIATEDTINLEDSQRMKRWPVIVKEQKNHFFSMTRGLKDFWHENHMQIGDILLFESVPNSVDGKRSWKRDDCSIWNWWHHHALVSM